MAIRSTSLFRRRGDEDQVARDFDIFSPSCPTMTAWACLRERRAGRGHLGVTGASRGGEDQVDAAALDVEVAAEVVHRDGPRTRCASRGGRHEQAGPGRLALPGTAPARSRSGSFLPGVSGSPPRSGKSGILLAVQARLGAERRIGGHRHVEVLVDPVRAGRRRASRWPRRPAGSTTAPTVVRRRQHPQRGHVLAEQLGLALGPARPVDLDPRSSSSTSACPGRRRLRRASLFGWSSRAAEVAAGVMPQT